MSSLRDQLQVIRDTRGVLNPEVVVEEARSEAHPLHARFEWDDGVAGERWRLQQAHVLIQSVKITYTDRKGNSKDIRAFQAVRHEEGSYVYEPTEEVIHDPVLNELVRREMDRDWHNLKARYDQFAEFTEMILADLQNNSAA